MVVGPYTLDIEVGKKRDSKGRGNCNGLMKGECIGGSNRQAKR